MTANATAILEDTAVNLATLDAFARDVDDRQLADCVQRLSALMQAMVVLLSDLPIAVDDDPRSPNDLPPECTLPKMSSG